MYLTWIQVQPESIGGKRFVAIVNYAKTHDDVLVSRS